MSNNGGLNVCLYCSRSLKFSGRNNPNKKYNFDDSMFTTIDTPIKAYCLGWFASDGHINKKSATISIKRRDSSILQQIRKELSSNLPPIKIKDGMASWSISSNKISTDICNHLCITFGKKSKLVSVTTLSDELMWHFIRGYFDGDGHIRKQKNYKYPSDVGIEIASQSDILRTKICEFLNRHHIKTWNYARGSISISGRHATKFLNLMYSKDGPRLKRKYNEYLKWLNGPDIQSHKTNI
jgi:hypothetical protein